MHADRHPGPGDLPGQRRHMILVGMDAARRHQAHQVAGAAAFLEGLDEGQQVRIGGQ